MPRVSTSVHASCRALLLLVAALVLTSTQAPGSEALEPHEELEPDLEADPTAQPANAHQLASAERRLSAQVRALLRHYQQPDPVGIPGAPVPDPLPVPNATRSIAMATVYIYDATVHGLSRFRVDQVGVDLANLSASLELRLEHLEMVAGYTVRYILTRSTGRLNVTLDRVSVTAAAKLAVARDGRLKTDDIRLDVAFENMRVHIHNKGLSVIMRSILETMAPFLYDTIKPFILKEAHQEVRKTLDRETDKLPHRFPNSLSPLDLLVWDARKLVAHMGFDPYPLPAYNYSTGLTTVSLSHVWLTGLSSFHRSGPAKLGFEKHVFRASVGAGTLQLAGQCHWMIDFAGYVSRAGAARFSVDSVQALVDVSQPLDTRQRPRLERFQLLLGNFAVRVEGAGTLDYVAELVANLLPNLLRAQIRAAIEQKVRLGVQSALDRIDVEELIENRLAELDEMEQAADMMEAEADILDSM